MKDNIRIVQRLEDIFPVIGGRRTVIIADSFFRNNPPFPERLGVDYIFIEASERNKSIETVSRICSRLLELEVDRDSLIIGLGGGITTDLTAFVASVFKRGIQFSLIPTTLLAQVDAAIGGKNGVNFEGFKNVIGCFSEPDSIWIWPEFIDTLPEREFRCGLAEMLKTFIIADADAYEVAVTDCRKNLAGLICRCIDIKCSIVNEDPKDCDKRHVLNLGHTFGHAIEKCVEEFRHGEAVAIGIIMASKMAEEKGIAEPGLTERLKMDFVKLGLPVEASVSRQQLEAAIRQDKKRKSGAARYVLPQRIGKVMIWDSSVTV